jgi:cysteine-rich repeat protein
MEMEKLGLAMRRELTHGLRSFTLIATLFTLTLTCADCATSHTSPGAGGSGSSSTGASTGLGGNGGGTSASASTSASTSTSTSTSASTSTSTSTSSGGAGGGFVPPVGTADYPAETEQNNIKDTANLMAPATKGFTASLYPTADVDVFAVEVTLPGANLTVAITDGMGGCPPGTATLVRIFNDKNLLLTSDTDSGPADCSRLTPVSSPELQKLSPGKYFVQVESADVAAIPFYIVGIEILAASCGDGIVQFVNGEQCDDGSTMSGDGCSATCTFEGNFTAEVESNDLPEKANLLTGFAGAVATINPAGDQDYFRFDIPNDGSLITLTVSDGLGGCPLGFDSTLTFYDAAKTEIASDGDGGESGCSKISPALDVEAGNLKAGTYYAKVEQFGNNASPPPYVLEIEIEPPACGNAILQAGEQCDDGNTTSGDGCSSTCTIEGNYLTETEPNNSFATENPLGTTEGLVAAIHPVGDQDYVAFEVMIPGSAVAIEVSDGMGGCPTAFDSKIYFYDPMGVELAFDDNGGVATCSRLSSINSPAVTNLAAGTYRVRVEQASNTAAQAVYLLQIKLIAPTCGDGVLQAGEQCDDGDTVSGDGCSSTCMSEVPFEIEPNNTLMTATPLWPGTSKWKGTVSPLGDHDYFSFTLSAPGSPTLATHDAGSLNSCSFDTMIHLLDPTGVEIAKDDDHGPGSCSLISPDLYPAVSHLPAGTYFVWLQKFNDNATIPSYELDLTVP